MLTWLAWLNGVVLFDFDNDTFQWRFCLFLFSVGHECEFKDTDNLYRFAFDEEGSEGPGEETYSEEDLDDVLIILSRSGPDAQLRMALRKS